MKCKIVIFSLLFALLIACRPSRETSKFVIETQLLEKDTNIYQKFDLIFTKYDRKNKSYLEIATVKTNDGTKFIFSSDVFANKIYVNLFTLSRGQEPFEKHSPVNYFVLNTNDFFSILKKLEKIQKNENNTTKDVLIYKSFRINSDVIFSLSRYYKPKYTDDGLSEYEYKDIEIWIGKRCHKIPYSKFKELF